MNLDGHSADRAVPPARAQILMVDDRPANLQALEAILHDLPCTLLSADSGEEALRRLRKDDAALILLDVNMPGMSGIETATLIRSHNRTRHIPIIFVSADVISAPRMLPQGYGLGAVDYILKPIEPAVLRAKVTVFIELYEKGAELHRQKELLQELQLYTRSLVESNLDALITTDTQGLITDLNQQAEALTGLTRQRLIGTAFAQHFAAPDQAAALIHRVLAEGRLTNHELTARAPDGRETLVSCNANTFRGADGVVQGVLTSARDVTERRRMEKERVADQQRVAELSRRLVAVQEEERRRLAGVVHDLISPNVAAAKLAVAAVYATLTDAQRSELDDRFADTQALLDDAIAQMRDVSTELRPPVLDYAGLMPAVRDYARQVSTRTGLAVGVVDGGCSARLPAELESALFRIVQEALHNCTKHARASSVRIELAHDAGGARLAVVDDGVGFVAAKLGEDGSRPGLGLLTMRERAEFAGGHFRLLSQPGGGTRIEVEIRMSAPRQDASLINGMTSC